jgi:hypothetical protein
LAARHDDSAEPARNRRACGGENARRSDTQMPDNAMGATVYPRDGCELSEDARPIGLLADRAACSVEDAAVDDVAQILQGAAAQVGMCAEELLAGVPDAVLSTLYLSSAREICRQRRSHRLRVRAEHQPS